MDQNATLGISSDPQGFWLREGMLKHRRGKAKRAIHENFYPTVSTGSKEGDETLI
jgi:hypothetical protein